MIKRKKNSSQEGSLGPAVLGGNPILDNIVRLIGSFGFNQIVPPPVVEEKIFAESSPLGRYFSQNIFKIDHPSANLILSPTHLVNVFKLYSQNVQNRGPFVAKWFYISPTVRSEGNQFIINHELGIFVLGEDSSLANIELINSVTQVFSGLGIKEVVAEITSRGCKTCQANYGEVLRDYLEKTESLVCGSCRGHMDGENILSVFDCQNQTCRAALTSSPQLIDFLDDSCRTILVDTLETIDDLEIPYVLNSGLSNHLAEEKILFRINIPGQEEKVLGWGGNYTKLISRHFGEGIASTLGFFANLEELVKAVPEERRSPVDKVEVFIIPLGVIACRRALALYRELQSAGLKVAEAMLGRPGIKYQLKEAVDHHCEIALIIGQKEAMEETVILRDMRSGMQELFINERVIDEVKKRLGK